nr:EOG090X0GO7 [Sida crystallina]
MAKSSQQIDRLPIKLTIEQDDLEDGDIIPSEIIKTEQTKSKRKPSLKDKYQLASAICTSAESIGHYVDVNPGKEKPTESAPSQSGSTRKLQELAKELTKRDDLMEKSVIKPGFEKLESVPSYTEGRRRLKLQRRIEASKTKGDQWFGLPATEMTEEKLRDLEVIQMRSILNPKQFYKKNDLKVVPKYFQVGRVVDQAADFYNSRVPRKDRKKTLVDELMADANFQKYNKRKYADIIQVKNQSTQGAHKQAKRLRKRKK